MSLALYMDVHVPRAITAGLKLRGVDVITAQEDGAATLPDPELLNRVTRLDRVLFTFDEDFLIVSGRSTSKRRRIQWHRLCPPIAHLGQRVHR